MNGVWHLALRHALHHRGRTLILTACVALTVYLPLASTVLVTQYERALVARSDATPLVAGARGNRFDLTLMALYFRASALPPIPHGMLASLRGDGDALAIPLHLRFTAQGHPIAATSPEYYDVRGLRPARGTRPLRIGDALLGARVAQELGLGPGDALFSDQKELYDISKPPALKLRVCGVLAESRGPDDGAVFVDIKTAWMLEGLAHGHDDVTQEIDERLVLGRADGDIRLSGAFIEYNEVTDQNAASFHVHGDPDDLPLSAILVFPRTDKARTILKARLNESRELQMVVPRAVVDDLLGFVFRIKAFLDGVSLGLAAVTALLVALVVLLSAKLRAREMETLFRIGASRGTTVLLHACELALVLVASVVLAALGALATRALLALPIA